MAEIKDKIVTVESLLALHEYNKETYTTKNMAKKNKGEIDNLFYLSRLFIVLFRCCY